MASNPKSPRLELVPNQKKVGIYGRVSTEKQADKGDSVSTQEGLARNFIDDRKLTEGWDVIFVRNYFDEGVSGKDTNRPELERLQRDIANGEINYVVTFKLDRITRSVRDFDELWDFFRQYNVEISSVRESFDTSTPAGKAMVGIPEVFDEHEGDMTQEVSTAS